MTPNEPTNTPGARPGRSMKFKLAALGLVLVSGLAGLGLARCLKAPPLPPDLPPPTETEIKLPPHLFDGWTKPDLVLLLSGQQHGYMQPCGCSCPQKGGLVRRYALIQMLEAKGWPVVAVDIGDVPQVQGPAKLANLQGLVKYRYTMKAMKEMKYAAVGMASYEDAQSLDKLLAEWALNDPQPPFVAANFVDQSGLYKGPKVAEPRIQDVVFVTKGGVKVAIGDVVGASVAELKMKSPNFSYESGATALPRVVKQMADGNAELRVLLYQGSIKQGMKGRKPEVYELIDKYPQFNVVQYLDEESDDEPSHKPSLEKPTMAVGVGWKGRYVGVIGVWKTGKPAQPFELKYQLVELGEEFQPAKADLAKNPVARLMEDYAKEIQSENYLAKYPQVVHPHEVAILGMGGKAPEYIGSESCKGCHSEAYTIWKGTPHSHAYKTLENATNPSLRQYDPECIVCHTVGYGYKTGFRDEKSTAKLMNVGCESCHGPGSGHRDAEQLLKEAKPSPLAKPWREIMNPWRTPDGPEPKAARDARILRTDGFCSTCHDKDNDVTWMHGAFERKWLKIFHYQSHEAEENRKQLIEEFTKKAAEQKKKEAQEKKTECKRD